VEIVYRSIDYRLFMACATFHGDAKISTLKSETLKFILACATQFLII
jgi:hypothetical protein